jgi:2'-5' RNA ligase
MGLLRAFLASELPSALQDAIQLASAGVRLRLGSELVRWVPGHNVHLTLKFLGDVSPSNLELIQDLLATHASQYQPFDVIVGGFGCYPNARRPRVLWIGLMAPPELASIQRELDAATARLGYSSEERTFSPHLTIGRVRQNASAADFQRIRAEVEQLSIGDVGSLRVEAIHLFKSELHPAGSVYTRLFSARLGVAET